MTPAQQAHEQRKETGIHTHRSPARRDRLVKRRVRNIEFDDG